ncbi:putative quinol monooxygenase [Herminiimonas arsenitoxidans]|uniref:putative quinol monooxygenase n=1 Tax=Herminiimonas arsenitoxidans TaxID=1809410 RepID=UPI00097136C2|nr:antibiotic biosynthesis monooxygenase [Herminiimonas arsenitoxidans]
MVKQDLVFYVQLHIKPEYVQEWKTAVTALIEQMAKEEAFVSCTLHQDVQDENLYTLYERWSEASVETFMANQVTATTYRQAYEERLPTWLQTPRTASVVRYVQEWRSSK